MSVGKKNLEACSANNMEAFVGTSLFAGLSLLLLSRNRAKKLVTTKNQKFVFAIHGGAGVIAKTLDSAPYQSALKSIVTEVYKFASRTDIKVKAIDVVEFAVNLLENEPLFNAGKGAVYTNAETVSYCRYVTLKPSKYSS